uniref:Phytocyanin domain-containing protein n=1 Tax=Oryza punctata TaxID=4537 RepID=A0A0E0M3Z6_ORYPU
MVAKPAFLPSATAPAAAVALLLMAAAGFTGATEYTVGDSEGWTIGPSYLAWSQKYNFTAGDTLVFNYVQRQHDVLRVTQDAFRTCDPANQTVQRWGSGHDVVELPAPGSYYFICNVSGHCLGGMKFSVAVGEQLPPPSPPPPPPRALFLAPPPPPTVGSGAAASSMTRRRWMALMVPVSCLALFIGMWN